MLCGFCSHVSLDLNTSALVVPLPVAKAPSTFWVIAYHAADAKCDLSLQKYNCLCISCSENCPIVV